MRILTFIFLSTLVLNLSAAGNEEGGSALSDETCAVIYTMAEAIMLTRQANTPLPEARKKMINGMKSLDGGDMGDHFAKLADGLIKMAYGQPLYNSSDRKKEKAVEFANQVYLQCLEKN